jgi:hypothetical protein
MNYAIVTTDYFDKQVKILAKKYHSFLYDLECFKKALSKNPKMGDDLGGNFRKVRMAIAAKNKGKSGGARVITYNLLVDVENTKIYLLTIYDKGVQDNISKEDIQHLKKII